MISFGIIGTGWITRDYVLAAHATGKWNLAAVYSRKEQTAKDFAAQFPDHKASINIHTSLEALVTDPSISTLYIASPNILHHAQAKQALQAGKHVILEKPSCSTSEELNDLFTTAKANNVILIEAFRHTQEPNFKLLKQNLARLGPIYGASFTFAQFSSRFDKVLAGETPGVFDLSMGGGALVDLGVYCIAAAVDLFGAPKHATYFPVKIATGADGAGTVMLQYEGFNVTCAHSKMFAGAAPSEVYGRDGTLSIPSITDITDVVFSDPRKKTRESVEGVVKPKELNLQDEAEEFARCILENDSKKIGEYEAHSRAVLSVLESCRRENGLLFEGGK